MKMLPSIAASFFLLGAAAVAQTVAPVPDRSVSRGATLIIDRGTGQGRIEIRCAESDSTRACVEAVLPIISVDGSPTGGVAYATSSIKCSDGTVYEVSTGTKKGDCKTNPPGQQKDSVVCTDGANTASATCTGGCGSSTNSGACTIK